MYRTSQAGRPCSILCASTCQRHGPAAGEIHVHPSLNSEFVHSAGSIPGVAPQAWRYLQSAGIRLETSKAWLCVVQCRPEDNELNKKHSYYSNERVTTALLLAAGTGSRLYPLTQDAPKCLTIVNGRSILERLVSSLDQHGFERLVVVTGYLESSIRDLLGNQVGGIAIEYIFSLPYKTTNNIFSLWMAREAINEPFLLLESDLVFDESLLSDMLYPDRIAVAKMQPWMNGASVTINQSQQVKAFLSADENSFGEIKYKTVNIYSLSLASWHGVVRRLDRHISEGRVNDYYETVFAEMIADGSLSFEIVSFDDKPWYEIDTLEDLAEAERLLSSDRCLSAEPFDLSERGTGGKRVIKTAISRFRGTAGILGDTD